MSNLTHPAQLQIASLNGSHHTGASQPHTPNGVGMVHTPYSCAHDLVPEGSEIASQMGQWPDAFNSSEYAAGKFSRSASSQSMMNSTTGGNTFSRRSTTSPQAEYFSQQQQQQQHMRDPWAGQHEAYSHQSPQQQSIGNSTGQSFDSSSNSSCSRTSSYNHRQATAVYSEHQSTGNQQPYPAFMMRAPIVQAPVHAGHLGGKAEYLEMPSQGAEITQAAQWHRSHKVFIGHVKFEIGADGLRWLIYMLTGVQAGKVEVRGMGCFMVFFGSAEEVFRVRGLHKRVLFDTNGLWFAQSREQEEALHHYAAHVAPTVHAKLPKGLMVVDEETSRRRTRKQQPKAQAAHQSAAPATVASGFQSHATADEMWSANQ